VGVVIVNGEGSIMDQNCADLLEYVCVNFYIFHPVQLDFELDGQPGQFMITYYPRQTLSQALSHNYGTGILRNWWWWFWRFANLRADFSQSRHYLVALSPKFGCSSLPDSEPQEPTPNSRH